MRTMGQKRAEFALEKALQHRNIDKFKSFSAGAPTMILKNGFGQALAFWVAKGHEEHIAMFNIVKEWLSYDNDDDIHNRFAQNHEQTAFLQEISQMQQQQYLTCQTETLKLLEWVKRYANADLGGE